MKRIYTKRLSVTLALALTATAILPTTLTTKAASPHTLSATNVTIYNGSSYDFDVNNSNGKMYTYTYATQNSKVVTIDKKGIIKAKGTGNTKITCKIVNKSTKKLAKTLTATVTVIDKMALSKKSVSLVPGATQSLAVNNTISDFYSYKYESENPAVATISSDTGLVTAVSQGTTKITCTVTNKAMKKSNPLTATVNVTASPLSFTAKQTTSNNLLLTFATALSSVQAEDITIKDSSGSSVSAKSATLSADKKSIDVETYNEFENGKVYTITYKDKSITFTSKVEASSSFTAKQTKSSNLLLTLAAAVSSVKAEDITIKDSYGAPVYVKSATLSADKKSIDVETYNQFEDGQIYTVTYKDKSTTFTAKIGAPARIVLQNQTIKTNVPTKIKVSILDANGVDITSNDLLSKISITMEPMNGYVDDSGSTKEITLYSANEAVTVSARYNSGTYNANGLEVVIDSNKAKFVASDNVKEVINFVAYSVATSAPTDWSKVSHSLPANSTNYKLYAKVTGEDGKIIDDAPVYESLDTNILVIDDKGGIYPMKQGTGYVRVTVRDKSTTCQVVVSANAKIASISIQPTTVTLSASLQDSNGNWIPDEQKVKILVKDQYGNNVTTETELSAETARNSANQIILDSSRFNNDMLTLSSSDFGMDGTYNLNVTATSGNDRLTKPVTVVVRSTTNTTVKSYRPTISNSTVDIQDILSTKSPAVITASIDGLNQSGIKVQKVAVTNLTITDPKGNEVNMLNNASFLTLNGGDIGFGIPNNGRMQLPMVGTYKIKMKYNTTSGQKETTLTVTVKNSATAPTVKVESTGVTLESYETADQANVIGAKGFSAMVNGRAAQSVSLHNYKVNNSKGRLEAGDTAYITVYSVKVTDEDENEYLCALTNNQSIQVKIKK